LSNNDGNYFFTKSDKSVRVKNSQSELDSQSQRLSEGIILANRVSKLCDGLEKRIKLATQKFGNVKEYAHALNSFSDSDVSSEISELNKLVADLTKDLPTGS